MSDGQHIKLRRRSLFQAGAIGLLGLGMDDLSRLRAAPTGSAATRARGVIFVFLSGGLSQLESFDMKPEGPEESRGEFRPIATQSPGTQVCEHLPLLAACSPLWSLCRSLSHREAAHGPGCHSMLSGHTELPPGTPGGCGAPPTRQDWPGIAALVNSTFPWRNNLPPSILLPPPRLNLAAFRPGSFGGQLGRQYDPWCIEPCRSKFSGCLPDAFDWQLNPNNGWDAISVPLDDPDYFRPPALVLPNEISRSRFDRRLEFLDSLERQQQEIEQRFAGQSFDRNRERAVALLTGSEAQKALFDVRNASDAEQDRYGRNEWGFTLLLARRLREAGVPLIQVTLGRIGCWDTHRDNFRLLKDFLLPPFDRGLSALLEDLDQRGLREDTLVVVAGEFGRTPHISHHEQGHSKPGRDHWPRVQSVLLAGGGVQGGRVVGDSDKTGGEPAADLQTPENLAATIYQALGIPDDQVWYAEGRQDPKPFYLAKPIGGLG